MRKNKRIAVGVFIILFAVALVFFIKGKNGVPKGAQEEVRPSLGDIKITVTTTGVVEPQNRLEVKPSISGRIEEILVREGDKVKRGDALARMSSTERAALVDAARSQGEQTLEYWEDVYKQTLIMSPIDGEVIVRAVEPGQTVSTGDTVLVLSDRLIVKAQFDETDIGKIKVGQKAAITLDAYPQIKIGGIVDHIAYESKLVNNVTIYDVDIVLEEIPEFFRSGMSTNAEVIESEHRDIMLIPTDAVHTDDETWVMVRKGPAKAFEKRKVELGLSDEKNVEVVSGLTLADSVIIRRDAYSPQKKTSGTNPFMPLRGGRR